MGSYRRAMMCGFLCRLCATYKDEVIHLYSNKGKELKLLMKIKILPIKIKKYDKLPKTICKSCATKLTCQYEYIQEFQRLPGIINSAVQMPRTRSPLAHDGNASTSRPINNRISNTQPRSAHSSSRQEQIHNSQNNIINQPSLS